MGQRKRVSFEISERDTRRAAKIVKRFAMDQNREQLHTNRCRITRSSYIPARQKQGEHDVVTGKQPRIEILNRRIVIRVFLAIAASSKYITGTVYKSLEKREDPRKGCLVDKTIDTLHTLQPRV